MAEARVERRLAAILAVDVAGYSRLMGVDEEGTLAALKACRRDFIDPKIAEHRGRIVKTTGDGALVEFASAVDGVRCAMEIQRVMAERNTAIPEDHRIEFRIGINVGDVIIDENDIYGDGVNIAARIESLAEPGAVCLSENAYQQIKGKLSLDVTDMGDQQLKNIAQRVRVYGIRSDGSQARAALALPDKPSIAVLPFQNISGDPEQEYFADGMVEDIITGLSRIKWLFVIARNSTFTYKGRAVDVKQVGRELGVRYVLEGSVRKAADRVRITASSSTPQRERMCGPSAMTESPTIFSPFRTRSRYQSSARSSRACVSPKLSAPNANGRIASTPMILSYGLYLMSIRGCRSNRRKRWCILERALALDPNYALAHACAAECYHSLFLRGGLREENRTAAVRHAQVAIANGQDDALALTLAGFSLGMDGHDRAAAFAAFEAALAVSPSSALTYILGSVILSFAEEAERAIEWGERGLRLSPLDPWRSSAFISFALGHFHRGRYEEAAAAARKAVQFSPGFSICHMVLAAPLAKLGRLEEARAAAARVLELQPVFRYSRQLASVNCEPTLAASLGEALRAAGLPE